MRITEFGRALRRGRSETSQTLKTMAEALGVSAAFISGMETGRNKVPRGFVTDAEAFFYDKGFGFPKGELSKLAMLSNESVPLNDLDDEHKELLAGFACSDFTQDELRKIVEVFNKVKGARNGE